MQRQIIYIVGIGLVVIGIAAAVSLRTASPLPAPSTSSSTVTTSTQPTSTDSGTPPSPVAKGIVSGHVDIGPICPGPQTGARNCEPGPEQYGQYAMQAWNETHTQVVQNAKIDGSGNYTMTLPAGTYSIDITPHPKSGIPGISGVPQTVKVADGSRSRVDVTIDTGIR